MKYSTLVFRSLAVIIFITGIAHLTSYASQKDNSIYNHESLTDADQEQVISEKSDHKEQTLFEGSLPEKNTNNISKIDDIVGKWKVTYNNEDFKGSIIYHLKKEGTVFNAYTYEYQDENGYAEKADGIKTLIIKKFNGVKGKGSYTVEYEGQQYQVDCQIDMIDKNTFKLSYDYYGYGDVEIWKRK
ncbi:hypothetical protein [Aquimarina litoralis]|uniref:hypothetical protein n=1 Tax=Aquimarina litoralis TaxID=584605 RepID=UPI001C596491|nr:hypothetical protein [Aquimarina litoralis]MBW1294802.1 hypothetical protein [Aquimarina litoralis]